MTTDVTNVQNAYQMILRIAVRAPLMFLCSMGMCLFISRKLSLIFLAAIAFLAAALILIMLSTVKIFNEVFRKYDDLNAEVQENVSAIRVVKAFVREKFENEKFTKAAENLYRLFVKAEGLLAFNNPSMMLVIYGCIIALSWFGAKYIVAGDLTTGELTSMFSYVMSMMMSLMMLSMVFVMITMSAASGRRIAEVLNETADLADPEEPVREVEDGSIDFHHVSFSYKHGSGEETLHDIDLHIRSGETVGIIGGTGSGKFSLANLISRLYDADGGSVLAGGRDVRDYDMEALRDQVAVMLQKNVLFSGTVLENLRRGKENASLEECREACAQACADEFIERLPDGYDTWIEQGGSNVNKIRKADLRRSLGMVLQDTHLFTGTVMDNIRYGRLDASDEECVAAAKLANAHGFIKRLPDGYQTLLTGDGANLSQGQRQLLAIARAAVADPPVLILDEATSSIDTRTETLVQEGMDRLMKGRTTFVIAHRLSAVKNSDCIMVLEQGRIIERGNHEELIAEKNILTIKFC